MTATPSLVYSAGMSSFSATFSAVSLMSFFAVVSGFVHFIPQPWHMNGGRVVPSATKLNSDFVTEGTGTIYKVLVLCLLLVNSKLLHDFHPLLGRLIERLL
jgi:hypothetical protein